MYYGFMATSVRPLNGDPQRFSVEFTQPDVIFGARQTILVSPKGILGDVVKTLGTK